MAIKQAYLRGSDLFRFLFSPSQIGIEHEIVGLYRKLLRNCRLTYMKNIIYNLLTVCGFSVAKEADMFESLWSKL